MQRNRSLSTHRADLGPRPAIECGLSGLARKAAEREAMDRALRQTLPPLLRERIRFGHLRGSQLCFLADSPAWASRLRLLQTQILHTAQAVGVKANSITIKVALPDPITAQPDQSRVLSSAAGKHLKAAANCTADPELRTLFLHLASFSQ